MEITRERCSFCGVERWTVAAMRSCITVTTFHSWTDGAGRPGELPASLDILLKAWGVTAEQFSQALQIQWPARVKK